MIVEQLLECPHDETEGWCAACGKPVDSDYGCGSCGVALLSQHIA